MENYFNKNQEKFILYFLSNPDLDHLNQERYEEMLSSQLLEHINNPQLLSLPVPILHRVLTKYQHKFNKSHESQPEITDFLFKYLDEHGIRSSCLFSFIDLSQEKTEYLYRLLNDYSNKFDFHFINSSLLKTLYKIENEFIETKQIVDTKQNETLAKISKEMKNFEEIKENLNNQKDQIKGEINHMKNDLIQIKDNMKKKEIDRMKSDMKSSIDQIKAQIKDDFSNDQTQLKNEINQLINDVRSEIQPIKDDLNQFKENSNKGYQKVKMN